MAVRADICRYRVDEDGTPFCGTDPGYPTTLHGTFCGHCGGRYQKVDDDSFADAVTQPTVEALAAALEHGQSTGVDTTEIQSAPEWTALDPMLAFSAGKESIHFERAASVEIYLAEQQVVYEKVAKEAPERLVQALLDRDRVIAQMGREIADGRLGGTLLREFVRAALVSVDRANDPQLLQDFLEQALGAAKADRRQLKLKGTSL